MIVRPGHSLSRIEPHEVYLIRRKDLINPLFFFKELDYEQHDYRFTKWTAVQMRARMFTTEQAVETFKAKFLQPYSCEIIRVRN